MRMSGTPPRTWCGFAREVIEFASRQRQPGEIPPPALPSAGHGGVFVTLHRFERLRGCMGTLDATLPLADAIRQAALCAALHDPRFPPVSRTELPELRITVSILSVPRPMRTLDDLELGRHGVLVRKGVQQGLFLPQVATEHRLDKETFLSRCCSEKAGLPPDAWRCPDTQVLLFSTEMFADEP
jgi:AmmeMemoRadiSam system protein A